METREYKSWRDFKKAEKEISERLPYVPYCYFHFGNTTRHRIYRKKPFKGVIIEHAIIENGKEYSTYTNENEYDFKKLLEKYFNTTLP